MGNVLANFCPLLIASAIGMVHRLWINSPNESFIDGVFTTMTILYKAWKPMFKKIRTLCTKTV